MKLDIEITWQIYGYVCLVIIEGINAINNTIAGIGLVAYLLCVIIGKFASEVVDE